MLTKKTLVMLSTLTLVTICVSFSTPTAGAAAKDTYSQKIEAKAETRPTLRKGSNSSYVRDLQQSLKDVKYNTSVDGIFGTQTQNVVKEFQIDHSLSPDGIVGPLTWAALDENKVERKQFPVSTAITFGKKELGENIVFSTDDRLRKDNNDKAYYRFVAKNKDWMDQGRSGTIGWYHIYKNGDVIEASN
ncbi:peptidoglycan-binding domain-containing protein [Priestia megaterium]|uniref:peptidoglycan-binding domain-containing protein n=1 Tax=Priestia megaterium TaxID=1404 RepID=UPI002A699EDE|nr:peptidoglycan-binding domain-containing protein [Priestia megaterium]MDY0939761.1 peptidoglycan-binding domain-containing protein [Priestia megaterium]